MKYVIEETENGFTLTYWEMINDTPQKYVYSFESPRNLRFAYDRLVDKLAEVLNLYTEDVA